MEPKRKLPPAEEYLKHFLPQYHSVASGPNRRLYQSVDEAISLMETEKLVKARLELKDQRNDSHFHDSSVIESMVSVGAIAQKKGKKALIRR